MDLFSLILFAGLGFLIYMIIKTLANNKFTETTSEFSQAKVTVNYPNKTITIKGRTYNVDQVKGIKTQAFRTERRGNSPAQNVVIEVEDISNPIHKITFLQRRFAEKFEQRLCIAIRKAGGPNFV